MPEWLLAVTAISTLAQVPCPSPLLPAYAHNDYNNSRPVVDAVALGYRGVEVDVFLVNGVLRVGHSRSEAKRGAAFETVYVRPIELMVERCAPLRMRAPFLLFIELKEKSRAGFDSLTAVLARHNLPDKHLQVILVGWYPPNESRLPVQYRFDEPEKITAVELPGNVALISLDYDKTIGRFWNSSSTRTKWLDALAETKSATPKVLLRVHDVTPDSTVYRTLLDAGVDLIGTKELMRTYRILNGSH